MAKSEVLVEIPDFKPPFFTIIFHSASVGRSLVSWCCGRQMEIKGLIKFLKLFLAMPTPIRKGEITEKIISGEGTRGNRWWATGYRGKLDFFANYREPQLYFRTVRKIQKK